ncbi:hypothetical protein AT984_09670 [Paucibacter sp. KCTC 42545]|nr:hypothetical protein AT984_09670 [Paucibacter sp. KCTC 42545]
MEYSIRAVLFDFLVCPDSEGVKQGGVSSTKGISKLLLLFVAMKVKMVFSEVLKVIQGPVSYRAPTRVKWVLGELANIG